MTSRDLTEEEAPGVPGGFGSYNLSSHDLIWRSLYREETRKTEALLIIKRHRFILKVGNNQQPFAKPSMPHLVESSLSAQLFRHESIRNPILDSKRL